MSWASRRKFTYLSLVIIFIAIIFILLLRPILFPTPSCGDNRKNGDEQGIDCGGSCMKICSSQSIRPILLWARAFNTSANSYNLIAYVENKNKDGASYEAEYEFKVYDQDNILIGRRTGKTFIPPNQRFAVFESRFDSGQKIPKNITFEFINEISWWKKESIIQNYPIKIDRIILGDNSESPSLSARVRNESVIDIQEFEAIAILYDENKNAIAVSKTKGENLKSNTEKNILFTWLESFSTTPVTKEVFLQINPFLFK